MHVPHPTILFQLVVQEMVQEMVEKEMMEMVEIV
jgi:hypothetical protein